MPHEDYMKALKAGRKDYHLHLSRGEYPYLQVLDEIIADELAYYKGLFTSGELDLGAMLG